mmetsp:Transcript_52087/g.103476  ORF Transcript_52087/g.103476 Transcript_52087/m.103476 type:complete len:468 (-) Transcript_52087:173-1576(-)
MPTLPESLKGVQPPRAVTTDWPRKAVVDSSPKISPRASPRWGAELAPAMDLAALSLDDDASDATAAGAASSSGGGVGGSEAVLSTEAADELASQAEEDKPAAPELVAMKDPAARKEAIEDVLGRLLAEGLEGEPGSKEAAAADLSEVVKAFGVQVLWTHGLMAALSAALSDTGSHKNTSGRVEGALHGVAALMRRCKCWFEPYVFKLFPSMLSHYGHKSQAVKDAAQISCVTTIKALNPRAARVVLPLIFCAMESPDWRVKCGAVQLIGILAKHASSQLNICMPLIVPRVTTCLRDTKKEVAKAAKASLLDACGVIGNPDILPVVPSVIAAIKDPNECAKALEDLMHCTFVHPVDGSSLAVIVPILSRSLTSRGAMHEKRKAATVIINMCKLVLNPSDVEPFVPKLLPELKKNAEDAAFEEIRGVCAMAEQVMLRAMGEAGIAEINSQKKEKDKKLKAAAAAASEEE